MNPFPVKSIMMHDHPHLDEILAEIVLRRKGEKHFPGIGKARVEFDGTGGQTFVGLDVEELLKKDGILLLGIGRSMFDEHPGPNNEGKRGECTSTLVAKYLGVQDEPVLKEILEFSRLADTKGKSHPLDLASIVKSMHSEYPSAQVADWVELGIDALLKNGECLAGADRLDLSVLLKAMSMNYWRQHYRVVEWLAKATTAMIRQQERFVIAQKIVHATPMEEIPWHSGKKIKMITTTTDNTEFNKAARAAGAVIIIQHNEKGQVKIFTNKALAPKLDDVVRMVRLEEQETLDNVQTTNWQDLAREGSVLGADMWYFQTEANNLFNGTISHPDAEPTKIPLPMIQKIVRIAVDQQAFESKRQETCRQGICSSKPGNVCSWYALGLQRCQQIRRENKSKA
ncbi:MAG: hypothetical protein EXS48_02550 [Candidatus Staskawiczbacteria bacterium]|nr:hypothetical protein [Candidatus Staskawiczbacteria bacterium]